MPTSLWASTRRPDNKARWIAYCTSIDTTAHCSGSSENANWDVNYLEKTIADKIITKTSYALSFAEAVPFDNSYFGVKVSTSKSTDESLMDSFVQTCDVHKKMRVTVRTMDENVVNGAADKMHLQNRGLIDFSLLNSFRVPIDPVPQVTFYGRTSDTKSLVGVDVYVDICNDNLGRECNSKDPQFVGRTLATVDKLVQAASLEDGIVSQPVIYTAHPKTAVPEKKSCGDVPDGGKIMKTGFSSETVPYGQTCKEASVQIGTCQDGKIIPINYILAVQIYPTCRVLPKDPIDPEDPKKSCGKVPDGGRIMKTGFSSETVPYGQTCKEASIQTGTCHDGKIIPVNNIIAVQIYPTCRVLPKDPESPKKSCGKIPHGGDIVESGYLSETVPHGELCKKRSFVIGVCDNGKIKTPVLPPGLFPTPRPQLYEKCEVLRK